MSQRRHLPPLPPSATSNRVGLIGLASATAMLLWCVFGPTLPPFTVVALLCIAYATPVILLELGWRKVHRNPSSGLDWDRPPAPSLERVVYKLAGLVLTLGAVIAFHALIRMFAVPQVMVIAGLALIFAPALLAITIIYIAVVDGRMRDPEDAYWQLGAMLFGRARPAWTPRIRDHVLGWMVKGFFLPLMLFYLWVNATNLDALTLRMTAIDPVEVVIGLTIVAVIVDLAVVCVGYIMTLRLFDAHIRSANPSLAGWLVTLVCYYPFSLVVVGQLLKYRNEMQWSDIIRDYPLVMWPWMIAIVTLFALHVWSKAIYGLRWSNLTNRGIITNGPYRYTKHPDYISKSVFFWLTAAPFLTAMDASGAVTSTIALLGLNLIYWGRAKTEEMHLSEDPVYVEYAVAMNDRSIFRWVVRLVPALKYAPPAMQTSPLSDGGDQMPLVPGE